MVKGKRGRDVEMKYVNAKEWIIKTSEGLNLHHNLGSLTHQPQTVRHIDVSQKSQSDVHHITQKDVADTRISNVPRPLNHNPNSSSATHKHKEFLMPQAFKL